ncbi:MAG: sporulation integral membrane protein YlbJ [Firmicutes bacterium]|nr:sporulation integral membrane protein YlbJ [Bacillota bacterium]
MHPRGRRSSASTAFLAVIGVAFVVMMVVHPDLAFRSAVQGLQVWWDVIFPALLPFFIGGQILMGLGVVAFLGVLMEPFMRPLFGVPGAGAFVLAMGLNSGYPLGASLTADLRRQGRITATEATRLVSFSNTSDPLFMAGAVAVGMLQQPLLAGVIMEAHYIGAILMGILLKFLYRPGRDQTPPDPPRFGNPLRSAFRALVQEREADGRPLGKLLGDAVMGSVQTLLMIGGFIILFSVLVGMMRQTGMVAAAARVLAVVLAPLGIHPAVVDGLISGFFEISIGSQATAQAAAPLLDRAMICSAIIAWSGVSVIAQVAAVTQGTGISILVYTLSRVGHAILAALFTWVLWPEELAAPALGLNGLAPLPRLSPAQQWIAAEGGWWHVFTTSAALWLDWTALLLAAGAVAAGFLAVRGRFGRRA